MANLDAPEAAPFECSPETPWGVHGVVTDNVCPRCGWIARSQPQPDGQSLSTG